MSPFPHAPTVQDILGQEKVKYALEARLGDRSQRSRAQFEKPVALPRRPHSTDQRRTSRGRQARRISDLTMPRSQSERIPQKVEPVQDESDSSDSGSSSSSESDTEEAPGPAKSRPGRLPSPASELSTSTGAASRSGSSSGSGSTITGTVFTRKSSIVEKPAAASPPNALSYLQKDSPALTEESIQRAVAQAAAGAWSPRSDSSASSSGSSSGPSDSTDVTSPDNSINGDIVSTTFKRTSSPTDSRPQRQNQPSSETKTHRYGTPEMARGSAKHPHLPPNELTPRVANPARGHPKHLPRAEKLPLTGYELLASKLSNPGARARRRSAGSTSSMSPTEQPETTLKPIYRRFEALNHRLLLHLQDELAELEEQLHRLDTADTQTRRLQNCILPASRRHESMTGGELQWHKTDILGKIGYKIGQYNHILSSFTETQNLPQASMADVEEYRTYLATENPIAEIETRFLDPAEDLVCLAPPSRASSPELQRSYSPFSDDALTPMPRKMTFDSTTGAGSAPTTRASSRQGEASPTQSVKGDVAEGRSASLMGPTGSMSSLPVIGALGLILSLLSLLAFPVITDFSSRIAVVLVASIAVAALKRNADMA